MRFIIYGAGAVGGVIGARLHQHGRDVVLIARGDHLSAVQKQGLTLITPEDRSTEEIPAVGHPREIAFQPGDVVLLTMKTQDTATALVDLRECVDPGIPVVCAQNGVENERIVARCFERVYGMVVWLPATFLTPGQIVCYSSPTSGFLDAGVYPEGTDLRIGEVCAALDASGFSARPQERIMRLKYSKLLANVNNALVAVLGPGVDTKAFARRVREETLACYEAAGVDYCSEQEDRQRREEAGVGIRPVEGQPPLHGSSWQSMVRSLGSIETDFLNGEIALLGRIHGVPTPCNRALQIAANRMSRRGEQPGTMSLAQLESLAGV